MFSSLSSRASLRASGLLSSFSLPSVNFCLRDSGLPLSFALTPCDVIVRAWCYLLLGHWAHFMMVTYFSLTSKPFFPCEAGSVGLCLTAETGLRSLPSLTRPGERWVPGSSLDPGTLEPVCPACVLSRCVPSGWQVDSAQVVTTCSLSSVGC